MIIGFDQGFRFQGQLFAVGTAQQIPFAQGIQQGFAVMFIKITCHKALADRRPWGLYLVTLIKEQVLECFPGQRKSERKRLYQAAPLKIGVSGWWQAALSWARALLKLASRCRQRISPALPMVRVAPQASLPRPESSGWPDCRFSPSRFPCCQNPWQPKESCRDGLALVSGACLSPLFTCARCGPWMSSKWVCCS